jgi:hypothetical protein
VQIFILTSFFDGFRFALSFNLYMFFLARHCNIDLMLKNETSAASREHSPFAALLMFVKFYFFNPRAPHRSERGCPV